MLTLLQISTSHTALRCCTTIAMTFWILARTQTWQKFAPIQRSSSTFIHPIWPLLVSFQLLLLFPTCCFLLMLLLLIQNGMKIQLKSQLLQVAFWTFSKLCTLWCLKRFMRKLDSLKIPICFLYSWSVTLHQWLCLTDLHNNCCHCSLISRANDQDEYGWTQWRRKVLCHVDLRFLLFLLVMPTDNLPGLICSLFWLQCFCQCLCDIHYLQAHQCTLLRSVSGTFPGTCWKWTKSYILSRDARAWAQHH